MYEENSNRIAQLRCRSPNAPSGDIGPSKKDTTSPRPQKPPKCSSDPHHAGGPPRRVAQSSVKSTDPRGPLSPQSEAGSHPPTKSATLLHRTNTLISRSRYLRIPRSFFLLFNLQFEARRNSASWDDDQNRPKIGPKIDFLTFFD